MAITVPQIQGAIQTSQTLTTEVQQLISFLNQVLQVANAGWQITTAIGGVAETLTLDVTAQNALLAQYATLKANLVATFGQLP